MPRLSIVDRMNNSSKMATASAEYKPMVLDYDSLIPSEENFYPIEEIEELADNMLMCGHIEPVVVGRVDGKDRIVSGHRRYYAIGMNIKRGHSGFRKVNCMIRKMSHPMYLFTLASANAFTRKLDDATLIRQAAVLRNSIVELVKSGEIEVHGKMRDYLADTLGISSTKMAQVDKINSSLIPEGKEALETGKINFSKAYETSRLPEETQRMVIEDESLLSADVREMVQDMKITCMVTDPDTKIEDDLPEEQTVKESILLPLPVPPQEEKDDLAFHHGLEEMAAYVAEFGLPVERDILKEAYQTHDTPEPLILKHESIVKGFELIIERKEKGGD